MNEKSDQQPASKLTKFIVPAIVLIVLAVLAVIAINNVADTTDKTGNDMSQPASGSQNAESETRAPDPVKAETESTGDTNPSDTGTAPGGNNSLLSEPPVQ